MAAGRTLRDEIARRVADRRRDEDMGVVDLARLCGVSQSTYTRWETAQNDIPTEALQRLAVVLRCRVGDFLPPAELPTELRESWDIADRMSPQDRQLVLEGITAILRYMRNREADRHGHEREADAS
jgi:transcriptional regulator with XRE-family HTH domain